MSTLNKEVLTHKITMNNSSQFIPAEKFKELLNISPICTVDVLFFNNDKTKTLLFKRTNEPLLGEYFSVGGRLFKNEHLEDCAVRKSLEEIGVTIDREKLVYGGAVEELNSNSVFEGVSYHAIDTFYGYILNNEDLRLDNQHSDNKWFLVSDDSLHPFIKIKIARLLKAYEKKI